LLREKSITMGTGAEKYGKRYWAVCLTNGDEVFVHADELTVETSGALVGSSAREDDGHKIKMLTFAVGPGGWKHAYAASVIDGGAVAVEHWDQSSVPPKKSKPGRLTPS
jgi:hypothetical protein